MYLKLKCIFYVDTQEVSYDFYYISYTLPFYLITLTGYMFGAITVEYYNKCYF